MPSRSAEKVGLVAGTMFYSAAAFFLGQAILGPGSTPERVVPPVEAKPPVEEAESRPGLLCLALADLRVDLGPVGESSYSISTNPDGSGGAGIYAEADWVEASADTLEGVLFRRSGPVGQYGPLGPPAVRAAEDSHAAVPIIVAERDLAADLDPMETWGGSYRHTPGHLAARDALDIARTSTVHALEAAHCEPVES